MTRQLRIRIVVPQSIADGELLPGTDVAEVVPFGGVEADWLKHVLWHGYAEPVLVEVDDEGNERQQPEGSAE
jgi:hypothetical protein